MLLISMVTCMCCWSGPELKTLLVCPWDERTCAYAAKQVWSLECVVGAGPSSRPSLFVLGMREHVHMLLSMVACMQNLTLEWVRKLCAEGVTFHPCYN
jgi:hypothetical protein